MAICFGVNMKTYFLDNCLSLHQTPQSTLFRHNEHGSYMYRITHWVQTFSAIKTENMSTHLNAFGKWKFKQSFIHLTKMVVLKMTGQDFPLKGKLYSDYWCALTSPTKLFTYKSCCFLTSTLISLLKVSNFDLSLLLPVFFCLCMGFISPANLPSYLRCNPGNWSDRPASFRRDMFIRRVLNERSYQIKVLLYWTSIRVTTEVFFPIYDVIIYNVPGGSKILCTGAITF